ncbi:MAG: hypothetical protein FJZ01_21105 [Candidatus Sericytochromatia bacterium]|nr:hypothetical protein [Candidatus Tanganyikabacteria bacterium]
MPRKVSGEPPRFLKLQGTGVQKAPVKIVAMYSGGDGASYLDEFRRRYGYMDYVVLQSRGADGTISGRVYAWSGKSTGANPGLAGASPGARGTIQDDKGKILYSGELFEKHDYLEPVVKKVATSPDGRKTARVCEAGYDGANLVLVRDEKSGKETTWQAGSRRGDLYLDAYWVGEVLLTHEGRPDDQLVLQLHDAGHFVSVVLGADQLRQDAAGIGLELADRDPQVVATQPTADGLAYRARFQLADGTTAERAFAGRFQPDAGGYMRLVDRIPAPVPAAE